MTSVLMTSRAVFPSFNSIPLLHLLLSFVTKKVDNNEVKFGMASSMFIVYAAYRVQNVIVSTVLFPLLEKYLMLLFFCCFLPFPEVLV